MVLKRYELDKHVCIYIKTDAVRPATRAVQNLATAAYMVESEVQCAQRLLQQLLLLLQLLLPPL
jgi:hypothetical protein